MSLHIIHGDERKRYHCFNVHEVLRYGWEKACILENIHLFHDVKNTELHLWFPYIPVDRFYILIGEMIQDGLLNLAKDGVK